MTAFKYFMKTDDQDPQVVSCMQYPQPAVASVKGYCRAQCWREARGTKTTQVNTCMAAVDHGRQLGQAAHRHEYKSRIVEFASGKSMHNRHS